MAKKKYPRLPNGFGSIKKLSGNRTNPYAVYPPVKEFVDYGDKVAAVHPKAITYVNSWLKGMAVLSAYHQGTYAPGQELPAYLDSTRQEDVVQGILSDYNAVKRMKSNEPVKATFKEVYEAYFKWKYEDDKSKVYSASSRGSTQAAFKNFKSVHKKPFCELTHHDFQSAIDACELKFNSLSNMVILAHGMSEYAKIYKIIQTDESLYLKVKVQNDSESGEAFTDDELKILWKNQNSPVVEMILIMCYSGYRVRAYESIKIDLDGNYFQGGVKNKTSKNRIVPIHTGILPLVRKRLERDGVLLISVVKFRNEMKCILRQLNIKERTPHDCRHTFSMMCEKYNVNENDRKRLLGHSFGSDITNAVYGHRSIDDLRAEVEKIKICY